MKHNLAQKTKTCSNCSDHLFTYELINNRLYIRCRSCDRLVEIHDFNKGKIEILD